MFDPSHTINMAQPINWQHPLNRGLISRWKVLPLSSHGTTWRDICGRHQAALTNTPTWQGPLGRPNSTGSLLLNGSTQRGRVTNTPLLNPSTITVSAWIKVIGIDVIQAICSKDDYSASGAQRVWQFRVNASNVIQFIPFNASTNGSYAGTVTVNDSKWHHVAGTWDGVTIYVYVDGKRDGAGSAYSGSLRTGQTNAVTIGDDDTADGVGDTPADFFSGNMDDICLYNRALSTSELAQLYVLSRQSASPLLQYVPSITKAGAIISAFSPRRLLSGVG